MGKLNRSIIRWCIYKSGLFALFLGASNQNINAATTYQETWESVGKHTAAPEWFQDAKFGIYFHWGVFSVPAYGNEWYPRNMYNKSSGEYRNHTTKYGDPFGNWQFHNFINGANDKNGVFTQFAPKLKSTGGKFDPDEWATLFDSAGAKFAGPVAEHHDGFSMWDSKVNEWNSVQKGPKLDLAGLFAKAFRAKGMKFIMTTHHAWNFTGYWEYPPVAQTDRSLQKLYGQLPVAEENQLWYDKLKEIIDNYQPDLIWHDLYLSRIPENLRLKFLAYYYNKSIDWQKDVIVASKDGFKTGEMHDYERGGPAAISSPYWLSDDAISNSSWCYTNGLGYYTSAQMLHRLIDLVSKNGNLMLNISPMADGSIPKEQKTILLAIGDWLRRFGESIYSTRAWSVYGEGPTLMGGGAFTAPKAGTNKDWRFTKTKNSTTMYAICLGWPGNGAQVTISSITPARFNAVEVYLLGDKAGEYIKINNFTQGNQGLTFTMPSNQPYTALAYSFKISSVHTPANGEFIYNGDFSSGTSPWILNTWGGSSANGSVINGEYKITMTTAGTNSYDVQLVQTGLNLEKGKSYEVKFDAYAASDRTLNVNVEMTNDPWTSYQKEVKQFNLTTAKQPFTFKFTMEQPSDANSRLSFNAGGSAESVILDNISVKVAEGTSVISNDSHNSLKNVRITCCDMRLGVDFTAAVKGKLNVNLFDMSGKLVDAWALHSDSEDHYRGSYDLLKIPAGFYIVGISNDGKKITSTKVLVSQ